MQLPVVLLIMSWYLIRAVSFSDFIRSRDEGPYEDQRPRRDSFDDRSKKDVDDRDDRKYEGRDSQNEDRREYDGPSGMQPEGEIEVRIG